MAAHTPKCIPCVVKAATNLVINTGDEKACFSSGCKVIDVVFQTATVPEISEIHLTNFYTALFTLRVKLKNADLKVSPKWRTCVRRLRLMPEPHCESGSHDTYILSNKQFSFELLNVTEMRFVLQQPSPVWKEFNITDIKIYKSPQNTTVDPPLPSWLLTDNKQRSTTSSSCSVNIDEISKSLLNMWALTEHVADSQSPVSLGRYDVNGCYDISLLNFT